VRLVQVFPGLRVLLDTLLISIPSFVNVGSCLLLVAFCYAVAGVQLYGDMDLTGLTALNMHNNFQSVPNTMLMLMRASTGEAWDTLLFDTINTDAGGGYHGYVYWLSYITLMNFVMLQMFIMVVVESFQREQRQRNGAAEEHIRVFRTVWRGFDPRGTGFVPFEELRSLLSKLPPPMGLREGATFADYIRYVEALDLMTWSKLVAFKDVLINVHRVTYGIGIPQELLEMAETMPTMIHETISRKIRRKLARQTARTRLATALAGGFASRQQSPRWTADGELRTPSRRTAISTPTGGPRSASSAAIGLRSTTLSPTADARRAAFRMSQMGRRQAMEAVAPIALPIPASPWLASYSVVDERRQGRDAAIRHQELEAYHAAQAARAEAAEARVRAMERAIKHKQHYGGHRPTTAEPMPLDVVIGIERITESVREWKMHRYRGSHVRVTSGPPADVPSVVATPAAAATTASWGGGLAALSAVRSRRGST